MHGGDKQHLTTDVLVIGAGGAGMYAAIEAARAGASVLLLDKSLVGRGGATIMAMMTVAAAIGSEEEDDWTQHFADTVQAGRGLCNQELVRALCHDGPARILEMDDWGVGWTREHGRIKQVVAPGHSRKRCVFVDVLNTGPATASTLLARVTREPRIRRLNTTAVTDLLVSGGRCFGALGWDLVRDVAVHLHAGAVVLATGGLTRLYQRNSASANMTGDGHALALRAGAQLVDMEFVQFFPIAHLYPRMVGLDPIMWDPFRYKLGGRLLNGQMEEFLHRYGATDGGRYVATRDVAAYAIFKEVAAGRGSPHGGAYLDFRHVPAEQLREAFGSVIGRLEQNAIDLTRMPVEVAPMAHYHMGGIRCDATMRTGVPGLYAAGEVVGGAHGANRLSGNAITEAFVFGQRAGEQAAAHALQGGRAPWDSTASGVAESVVEAVRSGRSARLPDWPAGVMVRLQELMTAGVGPLRTEAELTTALAGLRSLREEVLPHLAVGSRAPFNMELQDWLDLRNMLQTAEAVALAALQRRETRGAHVRLDFPETSAEAEANIVLRCRGPELAFEWTPVVRSGEEVKP